MSRFLFFVPAFYGHVNPALHVVKALTDRGEYVAFYTGSQFSEAVEEAGATFRAVPEPYEDGSDFLEEAASDMVFKILQGTVDSARDDRPDCVAYDAMGLPGLLLARVLGVPAARMHVQFPINEKYHPFDTFSPSVPVKPRFDAFDRDMQKICDFYHVPAIRYRKAVFHAEPLNIIPFPRSFVPAADSFDERFHFVGPLFDVSSEADSPAPSRSLLYISLGTVHSSMPPFYDICMAAFGNQSRRVVISTGDNVDYALFGSIPDQVSLYPRVPQMSVLRQAEIFINHGGTNSIMEALYHGVPMVAVPQTLEQRVVAERMAELHLGIVVELQQVTSHVLKEAVARLDQDLQIRAAVDQMQKLIRESRGQRQAVDLLMKYAS